MKIVILLNMNRLLVCNPVQQVVMLPLLTIIIISIITLCQLYHLKQLL